MKDPTLERVWRSREEISARCDFDAHKLVRYYQRRHEDRTTRHSGNASTGKPE